MKVEPPKQRAPMQVPERPNEDEPMQRLKVTVAPSLKQALDKQLQQLSLQQNSTGEFNHLLPIHRVCFVSCLI